MRSTKIGLLKALISSMAMAAVLALPGVSQGAKTPHAPKTRVSTGAASHVRGNSALLTGTIIPNGVETGYSYYFVYGPTAAYGSQTPTVNLGKPEAKVRVGQAVAALQPGATYHFRIVAVTSPSGLVIPGRDRTFKAKGNALAFSIKRPAPATYGRPFIFSGVLTGLGSQNHRIALQASPFPFLEAFSSIGTPGLTNGTGSFSFRVANLAASTQFRVVTLDPLPIYSRVVTVQLGVRVVLHVKSVGHQGLIRLYGTIAPAVTGAKVVFQVQKAVRPGKSEATVRWVSSFTTTAKKGGANASRFSIVTKIRKGGRYRAYVKVRPGPVVSAASQTTVVLKKS